MTNAESEPLILTLVMDDAAKRYFTRLRSLYFPKERNYLEAHIALFHNLPAGESAIYTDAEELAAGQQRLKLKIDGIVNIGNGTAYKIKSDDLQQLHLQLQRCWAQWLIPQDRQKLWPHITIQNKVMPMEANSLRAQLLAEFEPFEITGNGLSIWKYKGGPWEFVKQYDFGQT